MSPSPLRLWLVTSNYPSREQPTWGTFVERLARAWQQQDIPVEVIAPHPVWSPATRRWVGSASDSEAGDGPRVLRPAYASFSSRAVAPGWSTALLTLASFRRAARKAARRADVAPTAVYGHFLFPGGDAALDLATRRGLPAFAAAGEAQLEEWEGWVGFERARRLARGLAGIVSVSDENRHHCVERYGVAPERVCVLPNAVDLEAFSPGDRAAARAALDLPQDRPLLLFTGFFIERKGPDRVLAAARALGVDAAFLGDGPLRPQGEGVVFAGRVAPDRVATWLQAADLFVLPTRAEGSPNAVAEALACGVPVVSSDIPALREVVDGDCGVLVPPEDASALRAALADLLADPERRTRMGLAARARAQRQGIDQRARAVAAFLRERSGA